MTRLPFHRPARFDLPGIPDEKLALPNPPEAKDGNAAGTAFSLLFPLLSSVGVAAYMISFGRPIMIIIGLVFVGTAIATTFGMRAQLRNNQRQAGRRQRDRYRMHLADIRRQAGEIARLQRWQSAIRHPDPDGLWGIATEYRRVWERRPSDADFLRVRIGLGRAELVTPIQVGTRMDPMVDYDWQSLRAAKRLSAHMGGVSDQPAVIDIGSCGVLSLVGSPERTSGLTRALLAQVAVLHAPDDVGIVVDGSDGQPWDWAKWLPHSFEPEVAGAAGVVPLVGEQSSDLLDYLERELQERQDWLASRRSQLAIDRNAPFPRKLIVVLTAFDPMSAWGRSGLARALFDAAGQQLAITLIVLCRDEAEEPGRVDLRVQIAEDGSLTIAGAESLITSNTAGCRADSMSAELAELIARRLCPLRLTDEQDQILSRTVSLTEMLTGSDPKDIDFSLHWQRATDPSVLKVPIGTDGDGQPVLLDIKEAARGGAGPHGLIVGATGSGKSELLRTLIMGMAMTHSPELLSFVLIDFKGGAAFAPLAELPHVGGLITNLADDAAMIDRVHAALLGEQQRRQQLLRNAGNVDNLHQYQLRQDSGQLGADGRPLEPLPYLMIIVDEFGELLSDRPELADLFVQIGRVGRSLGMHLLMATQRLEEGRLRGLDSHLSYRLCLRTFSAAESRTVIGTPDAYRLPSIPGSAYLKVDESVYQRLRVAHVSAPYQDDADRSSDTLLGKPIVAFELRGSGPHEPDEAASAPAAGMVDVTEMSVVVDLLKQMGRLAHQVWLPPLPPALALDELLGGITVQPGRGVSAPDWPFAGKLKIPLGVVDLPQQQLQQPLTMDFAGAHGHLAIVGAPRMGRSTMLRTIMLAAMVTHTPEEMQFYCIDYGGGTLHPFAAAPHVGAVAGRSDGDLLSRTLAEIRNTIAEREQLFRKLGIDSVAEFRERRTAGLLPAALQAADIFLLVDNWGAVRTELETADAALADIAARGLGVGVHLVLTAGRWVDIRPALRDSIGSRLELRLNDPADSDIARKLAMALPAQPGRGLVAPGVIFQLALPRLDGRDTAEGLRDAQEDALAKIAGSWSGQVAAKIRLLPERVSTGELVIPRSTPRHHVPIGVAETGLATVLLDLHERDPHLMVFGDTGAGKTEFLRTWLGGLGRQYTSDEIRVVLVDYRRTLLGVLEPQYLAAYATQADAARAYLEQVAGKLAERMPPPDVTVKQLQERSWWTGPEVYVVVDDYDLLAGSSGPLAPLAEYIPHARDIGLHVVLTRRVANSSRTSMSDPVILRLRELGCGALIMSGDSREGVLIGDHRAQERPAGRGLLIQRGTPGQLVQIAMQDEVAELRLGMPA